MTRAINMTSINPFVIIGLAFSVLATFCAFFITYDEWSHHYASTREPLKYAIEAAIIAFLVFAALTVLAVVLLGRVM